MNRNAIKQWAITYPQSGDTERKAFSLSFPPAEEIICCQEEHEDGGKHLHLSIKFKKGISKANLLKWVVKKYPNDYKRIDIQAVRKIEAWNNYVNKEDCEPYMWKDESCLEKRNKKIEEKIQELIKDAPVDWGNFRKGISKFEAKEQIKELEKDDVYKKQLEELAYWEWCQDR